MICPKCQEENIAGAGLCQRCGTKLVPRTCGACGKEVRETSRFCPACGAQVLPGQGAQKGAGGPSDWRHQTLKDRTMLLKQQFGQMVSQGNYKQVLSDKNNSFTQTLIDFVAWGITNFFGFASFLAAITIFGILLGPWGIVLTLALTYVYVTYKKDIDERIKMMKNEAAQSLPPPPQYQTSYQAPPPSAYPAPQQSYPAPPQQQQQNQYAQQITPQQSPPPAAPPYVAPQPMASLGYYYQIDERCTGCGDCVPHCPRSAIFQISQKYIIDQSHCNQSGRCVDKCPVHAIVKRRD